MVRWDGIRGRQWMLEPAHAGSRTSYHPPTSNPTEPVVKHSSIPLAGDQVSVFSLNSSDNSSMHVELKTTPRRSLTLVSSKSESRGERRWVIHLLLHNVFDISPHFIK